MAKLIIELDDTVDSKENFKRYADALIVLSGEAAAVDIQGTIKTEPIKEAAKVTVTDETASTEKTETAAQKKKRIADEKKATDVEAAKKDQTEKTDDEATEEIADAMAEEAPEDEASETELSHDEIVALIRPLLSSKAKLDGGRDKIRAEFTKHGASGLGNLSAEKAWPMYEFLRDLA